MSRVALRTAVNALPGEALPHHRNRFRWSGARRWLIQQVATRGKLRCATAIAQDAVVPNAHASLWQDVQEEAPNAYHHFQGHDVPGVSPAPMAPLERDLAILERHEAVMADGDAVGIPTEVAQDMMGRAKRRLGIDDPVLRAERLQEARKTFRVTA